MDHLHGIKDHYKGTTVVPILDNLSQNIKIKKLLTANVTQRERERLLATDHSISILSTLNQSVIFKN